MNKKNIKVKNIIPKCGADVVIPFAFIFIFYVILHGHLSPGGGFQGGILAVAIVALLYLGYDYKTAKRALAPKFLYHFEGFTLVIYIAIAIGGVVMAGHFCQNFKYLEGQIGDLYSSGTIANMDEAVAFNVITGSVVLTLGMLGLLMADED